MTGQRVQRLRAYRNNIQRYRRLLTTRLMDHERAYIERRLNEEKAAIKAVLQECLPEGIAASRGWVAGRPRTSLDIDRFLDPASAFGQPMDVVEDCDLTPYEKHAILSIWAARACDLEDAGTKNGSFDAIVNLLSALEGEASPPVSQSYRLHATGSRHSTM